MFYLHVEPIFPTVRKSDALPEYGAYFPTVGKSDVLPAYGAYYPNRWEIWCFTWTWSLFPNSWEIWCFTCIWSLLSQQLRNLMLYLNMEPISQQLGNLMFYLHMEPIFPTVEKSDVLPEYDYGAYFPNSWEIWCFTCIWSLFSQQLGNLMLYLNMEPISQQLGNLMFYLHMEPIFPTVEKSDVLPEYGAYFPNSWEIWCFYLHMEPIFPTVGKSDVLPEYDYGAYFPNSWGIWCFTCIWSLLSQPLRNLMLYLIWSLFPNSWEIWCFTCIWSLFSQQLGNLMFYLHMEPIFPTVEKSDVLPEYGAYFPNSWEIWCFTCIWSLFSNVWCCTFDTPECQAKHDILVPTSLCSSFASIWTSHSFLVISLLSICSNENVSPIYVCNDFHQKW